MLQSYTFAQTFFITTHTLLANEGYEQLLRRSGKTDL
jgi:hypothetical protein